MPEVANADADLSSKTLITAEGTYTVSGTYTFSTSFVLNDSVKVLLGTGSDAQVYYDGTDLIVKPAAVGSGEMKVQGGGIAVDATERVYFDGGSNSYIAESSADVIQVTAGGVVELEIDGNASTSRVSTNGRFFAGQTSDTDWSRHRFAGNYTSGGASTVAAANSFEGTTTAAAGDTTWQAGTYFNNKITTQGSSEVVGIAAQLYILEPGITVGSGDSITTAATVYIVNAPTEATNNYALVCGSTSRYDGHQYVQGDNRKVFWGAGDDASIYYDGTDMILDPAEVGSGHVVINADSKKLMLGAGKDASLYYDGTDLIIDPAEVGTGDVVINADSTKLYFGTGKDAAIYYTGTNLVIDPGEVGTGDIDINGASVGVDATEKVLFDGVAGHTYLHEVSSDQLDIVVGGTTMIEIDQDVPDIQLLHPTTMTGDSGVTGTFTVTPNPSTDFSFVLTATTDTPASSPETDAETGWVKIQVGGATRYIPFYT